MMMAWERPRIEVEKFIANEYVAACGDDNKVYKFTCDAGGGKSGSVYLETNNTAGFQNDFLGSNNDQYLSGYHACGTTHEAKTTDEFLKGYYVTQSGGIFNPTYNVTEVIVWRGPDGDNTHCTTKLNMDEWVTAKS